MSDRQYLINNQWLSYDEAHNLYGMTILKPQIITLYTSDLNEVSVRKDVSDNTYYDAIAKSWVSDISLFSEKLFLRLEESKLYKGSVEISSGFTFSDSIVNASPDYVDYNYNIVSIEDIKENYGITNYECVDYIIQDGELLAWYDSKTDMYWDDRPDKKEWTTSPPKITPDVENQDIYIAPSTTSIVLQDYSGIQPVFSYFRSNSFPEQDLYFEEPAEIKTGFQIYPDFEYFYDKVYRDDISYNISLYVDSEDGITSPHTDQYFQYGYAFTGDLAKVWVDSDEDVTFYRENSSYIFGKTHDEYHDESNPLYWCVDTYKTESQLRDEGYSTSPTVEPPIENFGEIIPVFFSTNGADSPQVTLDYSQLPVYDVSGNPVYIEEGWIYKASDSEWMWSIPDTSVLATTTLFPLANNNVAVMGTTPGDAAKIWSSQQILAQGAYLFRAREKFYTAWPESYGGEARSIAPGESVDLFTCRNGLRLNRSYVESKRLRAAFNQYAEYLNISTLEVVLDTNYAYLKNNGTEAVDVYCLIFSD